MTACMEIVIYKLKPQNQQAFAEIHPEIQRELRRLPGFLRFETAVKTDDPDTHIDRVVWRDRAFAEAAYSAFKTFPQAKAFMSLIEEVSFSGHFLVN